MGKFDSRLVILIFSTLTVILSGGGVAGGTPDKSRTAANRNEEMLKELGVEIKMKGKAIFYHSSGHQSTTISKNLQKCGLVCCMPS